jgi:hypothetical protein
MFELKQTVRLANVNPRAELHGEDPKPAFDLKIEATCHSSVLIHFHTELRQHLFKRDENPDLVDQVSEEGDGLTLLRYPKMGPIKWEWEGTGYTATIDYGLGGDSNIVLHDCKLDHFKIEPQNGGSVLLTFRIIAHPDSEDVGAICEFMARDIDLVLAPPEAKTADDLFPDNMRRAA